MPQICDFLNPNTLKENLVIIIIQLSVSKMAALLNDVIVNCLSDWCGKPWFVALTISMVQTLLPWIKFKLIRS
jgi:hypothetical protein